MVSMQSSAQEVTMLFKLIAAAKDSWACWTQYSMTKNYLDLFSLCIWNICFTKVAFQDPKIFFTNYFLHEIVSTFNLALLLVT